MRTPISPRLTGNARLVGVQRYIRGLRRWITVFRGVATRYLASYLAWYRFLDPVGGTGRDAGVASLLAARFP
ncbi:MAG: hypothetical protein ACOCUW_02815 [Gemmatimonadota bacterium]